MLDLFGAELVIIDGSKFKAVNNNRRHYTQEQLQEKIDQLKTRQGQYEGLLQEMAQANQSEVSLSDPDQPRSEESWRRLQRAGRGGRQAPFDH